MVGDAQVPDSWLVPSRTDDRPWHAGYGFSLVSWSPAGKALWLGEYLEDEFFGGVLVVSTSTGRVTYVDAWPSNFAWSDDGTRLLALTEVVGGDTDLSGVYVVDSEAGTAKRFETGLLEVWDARWLGPNRVLISGLGAPDALSARVYEMDLLAEAVTVEVSSDRPSQKSLDRVLKWSQPVEADSASCGDVSIGK